MRNRILYRVWPPYRRRMDRIYELRWDLWFHSLKAVGLARAVSVAPNSPIWESAADDWHEHYAALTAELDALRGAK